MCPVKCVKGRTRILMCSTRFGIDRMCMQYDFCYEGNDRVVYIALQGTIVTGVLTITNEIKAATCGGRPHP